MNQLIEAGKRMSQTAKKFERPVDDKNEVLILGDSLAYGVGASTPENSLAGVLAERLAGKSIENKAEIGETIGSLRKTLDDKQATHYEQVYIVVGGNDIMRMHINVLSSRDSLKALIKEAAQQSDQVTLVTTGDFKNVTLSPFILKTVFDIRANTIRRAALELETELNNFDYVDFYSVPFEKLEYKQLEAADGYHLNDRGIQRLVSIMLQGNY